MHGGHEIGYKSKTIICSHLRPQQFLCLLIHLLTSLKVHQEQNTILILNAYINFYFLYVAAFFFYLTETLPTLNYCSLLDSKILRAWLNYTFDFGDNNGFEAFPNQT